MGTWVERGCNFIVDGDADSFKGAEQLLLRTSLGLGTVAVGTSRIRVLGRSGRALIRSPRTLIHKNHLIGLEMHSTLYYVKRPN